MSRRPWKDESYALSRTYSSIERDERADGDVRLTGTVRTPVGLVRVYSGRRRLRGGRLSEYTLLSMIHRGREHSRSAQRFLGARGLANVAGRFARDVVAGRVR